MPLKTDDPMQFYTDMKKLGQGASGTVFVGTDVRTGEVSVAMALFSSLLFFSFCFVRPMTMETRCSKVIFPTIRKRNRLKIRSYRRHGDQGKKMFLFLGLFVHAAVLGGACAFTLKTVNTLIKHSSRDDRPSIST